MAQRYKSTNGIGVFLRRFSREVAIALLMPAIQFAYISKVDQITDVDSLKRLLVLGVLSYHVQSHSVTISPALLLLLLSEFGKRDLTVLDSEGFEHLVAIRELCHIFMQDPLAAVDIILLRKPVPSTTSNSQLLGKASSAIELNICLPKKHFFIEEGSTAFSKVHPNSYLVVVNGPRAAAPDVLVLPPKCKSIPPRIIQAKKYRTSYDPSPKDLLKEIGKLGLDFKEYPATYLVLKALVGYTSIEPEYVFVLRSPGELLAKKLQLLKAVGQVKGVAEEDVSGVVGGEGVKEKLLSSVVTAETPPSATYLESIKVDDFTTQDEKEVCIRVEEVHALWQELILDRDNGYEEVHCQIIVANRLPKLLHRREKANDPLNAGMANMKL